MKYTKVEIFEAAKAKRIPLALANSMVEVMESRQLKERGFFVDVGKLRWCGQKESGSIQNFMRTRIVLRNEAILMM